MLVFYLYIIVVSTLLGSFYNVVGLRIPMGKSIVKPRSSCPKCKHYLSSRELIPILSFLLQKGSCRFCGNRISLIYPFMELGTAILFTISPFLVGWSKELIVSWTLISLLMIIFVSDIKYMIIPDKVLLFFAPLLLIERIFIPLAPWWDMVLGSAVGFVLLLLIAIVSKGGMGGGDIKLYAVIGLVLGWQLTLLSFFLATIVGMIIGLTGMLSGKVKRGKPMPFGPAIVLGTLLAYFFGHDIISWYLTLFVI